jgi:DNA invertase Pin-like site-specific DNA recombinase
LARNVQFISGLMESGVEFIAADMPTANKLTVHIMAAFAEHEVAMISSPHQGSFTAGKGPGNESRQSQVAREVGHGTAGKESSSASVGRH